MKNILLTSQIYAPPINGGSVVILQEVYKRIDDFNIFVLAPAKEGADDFDAHAPHKIIRSKAIARLGSSKFSRIIIYIQWLFQLVSLCKKHNIHMIHVGHPFTGYEGLVGLAAGKILGIPCYFWIYGEEITKSASYKGWRKQLGRWMLRRATAIITISQWTQKKISEYLNNDLFPCVIAYPGVDTDLFKPDQLAKAFIKERHALPDGPIILCVSRLEPRKGIQYAIQAMPEILSIHPQATLIVVGGGPEEEKLRQTARDLNISKQVIFAGYQSPNEDLPKYYAGCDLFVVPTVVVRSNGDTEGFGMVFIEANACGKPVVAGRSGATEEAVEDGVSGLLIDVNSAADVARAALRLLDDPAYAAALAANGLERVRRHFTWDAAAAQLQDFCTSGEPA